MFQIQNPGQESAIGRVLRRSAGFLRHMSLKTRVVLLVVLMLVAGIWGLALSVTLALERDLTQLHSANLSEEVANVAMDLDRDVRLHIDALARLAASLTSEVLADPVKLDRALDQFADSSVIVPDTCIVANGNGIITAGYPEHAVHVGASVGDLGYFREVIASGKPVIGAPTRSGTVQQRPGVPIAVPLRNGSGATVGALVGQFLLSDPTMLGQLHHTRIGERGYFLVFSPKDRLILAAPDQSRILQRLPAKGVSPLLDRRVEDKFEGPGILVNALGVEHLGVARTMATTGWMVLAAAPTKKIFAPIEDLKRRVYLAALLISLSIAVVLRFFLARQFAPLKEAGGAIRRMTEGKIPMAAIPVARQDEIGELIVDFNRLVVERGRLEQSLQAEIIERTQAEQVREQLTRQLELLSERLATVHEDEHRDIAYELHEQLGQELATLQIYLETLGTGDGGTHAQGSRDNALALTRQAIERVRKLVQDIDPPQLEELGLYAAVATCCRRQATAAGWKMHIDAPRPDARPPRAMERACFRVLQEALNNVLRHAQAREVWVYLHQDAEALELGIRDDGIGFDVSVVGDEHRQGSRWLGLFGMQMRVKQAGGRLQIESSPGAGTELYAVFPLPVDPDEPV